MKIIKRQSETIIENQGHEYVLVDYKYIAQDASGLWVAYKLKPKAMVQIWLSRNEFKTRVLGWASIDKPWRESLTTI